MKKKLLVLSLILCILFSFVACGQNEPRKATEAEARVIKAVDNLNFKNLDSKNENKDALRPENTRALTELEITTGDVDFDSDFDAGDSVINSSMKFNLSNFEIKAIIDEQSFSFGFNGSVINYFELKMDGSIDINSGTTVDINVSDNGKKYNLRIEYKFSGGISTEKLYYIDDVRVTL